MRTRFLLIPLLLLTSGLALPAPADDKPTPEELQTRIDTLKELGIAFHGYGGDHEDQWADDITDKDGGVLLSWRVALLPYLEEEKLYKQFKLDEPWDSEHNKKLIAKMPKVYAPVGVKAKPGETYCQRFVGKDALFNQKGTDFKITNVPDGLSKTVLVAEAGDPVIWTKPADLPFVGKAPLPKLGGPQGGDFYILMCDGAVLRINKNYDQNEMKKFITPNDGKQVDGKKLQGGK